MQSNFRRGNTLRLAGCLLTIALMAGHSYLPKKREQIHPYISNVTTLYFDGQWGGKSKARWIDETAFHWVCDLRKSDAFPVCGFDISFQGEVGKPRDFSDYDELAIHLNYRGSAQRLRVYTRNHNPAYSSVEDPDSFKFNSVTLKTTDFIKSETIIRLSEFSVADWWLDQLDIPREHAQPELNNLISMGIDLPAPHVFGEHSFVIKKIELVGDWIKAEQLYLGIILAWMAALAWEAIQRIIFLHRRTHIDSQRIRNLTDYANVLQKESEKYKELSTHDTLTGLMNRAGLASTVEDVFSNPEQHSPFALIIFDIDHFKRINDKRGHDAGDRVLSEVAALVRENTRSNDALARWGGEEFIILSSRTTLDAAKLFAEKLRRLIMNHRFEPQKPLQVTASFGVAAARNGDDFTAIYKRADQALYQAKELGRNCVITHEK